MIISIRERKTKRHYYDRTILAESLILRATHCIDIYLNWTGASGHI